MGSKNSKPKNAYSLYNLLLLAKTAKLKYDSFTKEEISILTKIKSFENPNSVLMSKQHLDSKVIANWCKINSDYLNFFKILDLLSSCIYFIDIKKFKMTLRCINEITRILQKPYTRIGGAKSFKKFLETHYFM